MRISPVSSIRPLADITSISGVGAKSGGETNPDAAVQFKDAIKKAVGQVNSLQAQADDAAVKLATGDAEDVHKAMIAMSKAKLALDFTVQVRNKVIEAYQEVMRTQV